jgi:hypothetical protein
MLDYVGFAPQIFTLETHSNKQKITKNADVEWYEDLQRKWPTSHSCGSSNGSNGRHPASALPIALGIQILKSLSTQRRVSLGKASSKASTEYTIPRENRHTCN